MLNNVSFNSRNLALATAALFLEGRLQEPAAPRQREEIAFDPQKATRFEGTFRMDDGMEIEFTIEDDALWVQQPDGSRYRLYPESETSFFMKETNAGCTFEIDANGAVNHMTWHQFGQNTPGSRTEKATPLTPDQLALFAGTYYQTYFRSESRVAFEEGTLSIRFPETFEKELGLGALPLFHVSGDRFLMPALGLMYFTRDDRGQVDGFVVQSVGRMENIPFSRN
jgi:hypothetical protein